MREFKRGPFRRRMHGGKYSQMRPFYERKGRYRPSMGGIGFFSNYYKSVPIPHHRVLRWRK